MLGKRKMNTNNLVEISDLIVNTIRKSNGRLLNTRDNFRVDSQEWEMYNMIHALELEMAKPSYSENLMVIENDYADEIGLNPGFTPFSELKAFAVENKAIPMRRSLVEYHPKYSQLIANAIVKSGDNYMFLKRCKSKSQLSELDTFTGGHVRYDDISIYVGLMREIKEEIKNVSLYTSSIKPLGFIRDLDGLDISRHHICLLFFMDVGKSGIRKLSSKNNFEKVVWYKEDMLVKKILSNDQSLDNWVKIGMKYYLDL